MAQKHFQIKTQVTFSEAIGEVKRSFNRMSRQTTVKGLFAEIRAFANYMIALERRSPIVAEFQYEDVQSMDSSGFPRLEKMKRAIIEEILIAGDRGAKSYYTAPPVGRPFQSRIRAAQPVLEKFMFVATRTSRKNAKKAHMRGIKI